MDQDIQTLQNAGKNVLISVGGGGGFPSSAYQSYAQNVNGFVTQIVNFVTRFGFNGVDIDYEDSSGFTGSYDGAGFLTTLTNPLAGALPSGQNIITHAPQTPYWDSSWNNAPYAKYGTEHPIRRGERNSGRARVLARRENVSEPNGVFSPAVITGARLRNRDKKASYVGSDVLT